MAGGWSVAPNEELLAFMRQGVAPPAFLGMIVNLGEAPFFQLVASNPSTDAQLRQWLALPETRRAIMDALLDELDRLA